MKISPIPPCAYRGHSTAHQTRHSHSRSETLTITLSRTLTHTHTHTHTLAVHASENTRKSSVHMSSQRTAGKAEKRPPRWKQPPAESQPASHTQRWTAHGSDTTTCSAGERGRPAAGGRPADARNMRIMVRNKKSTKQGAGPTEKN